MNQPFVIILFGATGDLAKNKLFPALFSLFKKKELGVDFFIIGFSRREYSSSEFKKFVTNETKTILFDQEDKKKWLEFLEHLFYQPGNFQEKKDYLELIKKLHNFDCQIGVCLTRIFYLATPPENYNSILDFLNETKLSLGCIEPKFAGISEGRAFIRIAIEKPFGKDLKSARNLDIKLAKIFKEQQIFRVDHYLGKETVQNMLIFRFANGLFEPIWNKDYIDHVQITFFEKKGIENRGNFFDGVGLLRDVGQNHLMQLISSVVTEAPRSFQKEDVRDTRVRAIEAIEHLGEKEILESVVRGQYEGYLDEKNVLKNSQTETYVALKLFINTPRFKHVPFYVRTGKGMVKDEVKISLVFKQICHVLFKEIGCPEEPNVLTFRIQPNEGVNFRTIVKKPGTVLSLTSIDMHFSYSEEFGKKITDAYEKVLLDIINCDQLLFNRSDELKSSWEFITKILKSWNKLKITNYEKQSLGPIEGDNLIEKDGRKWL